MFDREKEKTFLNGLKKDYTDEAPYSVVKKHIIFNLMKSYFSGEDKLALELGCANGIETELLSRTVSKLVVVDGSSLFIEKMQGNNQLLNVEFKESLFEEYNAKVESRKFDFVVCNYILEHVYDLDQILQNIKSLMHTGSICFVTVPNRNALSRKLALEMGLIQSLDGLTENDHKHGHRRTFDFETARESVLNNGFEIIEERGVVLKILADFQLNKLLKENVIEDAHIEALNRIAASQEFMRYADSIFMVLKV